MAVTLDTIITELERRNYPCFLTTNTYEACSDKALRELGAAEPLIAFGTFPTVTDQPNYYIFDTEDATTSGMASDAALVKAVYWSPGGDFSATNIFSATFQLFSQVIIFGGDQFHRPADMIILRQKIDAWRRQFGPQGWEIFGEVGDPDAYLKLYPTPKQDGLDVLVEWTIPSGLADLTSLNRGRGRHFMMWMEVFVAEALANYYARSAGVQIAGFKDSDVAYRHWMGEAKRLRDIAVGVQSGAHAGEVGRA